jgi:hypothetical protein
MLFALKGRTAFRARKRRHRKSSSQARIAAGSPSRTRILPSRNRCGFGFNSGCLARFRAHRGVAVRRQLHMFHLAFSTGEEHASAAFHSIARAQSRGFDRAGLQLKTRLSRRSAIEHILRRHYHLFDLDGRGLLRHTVYVGLREDKPADRCDWRARGWLRAKSPGPQ